MMMIELSLTAARRFILGRQGLWPGRRWRGLAGTAQALRACEAVQIDPLVAVARNHDLILHSRVVDYEPAQLDRWLYTERAFFDWGGAIFVYPMDELPYWRVAMQRKGREPRWINFAAQHADVIKLVRSELRRRGPLGNRDFDGRPKGDNYRSGKDTGLAMYYLWLTGELMTHHRRNFDRIFDFRSNIVPPQFDGKAAPAEAEDYFARKSLAFAGLSTARSFRNTLSGFLEQRLSREAADKRLQRLVDAGEAVAVTVEGWSERLYALAGDAPDLQALRDDRIPEGWQPLETTTCDEATFLAPLDIVSARGRAKVWFDFDYVWEVYKPAHARRWGYYTLPILYGDRLVARFDPKHDRTTNILIINGLWLEDAALADDVQFVTALARGLLRFKRFLAAAQIDLSAIKTGKAETHVARQLTSLLSREEQ